MTGATVEVALFDKKKKVRDGAPQRLCIWKPVFGDIITWI